jgi:hypothetical protein
MSTKLGDTSLRRFLDATSRTSRDDDATLEPRPDGGYHRRAVPYMTFPWVSSAELGLRGGSSSNAGSLGVNERSGVQLDGEVIGWQLVSQGGQGAMSEDTEAPLVRR